MNVDKQSLQLSLDDALHSDPEDSAERPSAESEPPGPIGTRNGCRGHIKISRPVVSNELIDHLPLRIPSAALRGQLVYQVPSALPAPKLKLDDEEARSESVNAVLFTNTVQMIVKLSQEICAY
ncbi:hypothetical protein RvY_11883 [Ramazzottius varieornatus]|uniref:Uncharacterized protein n=1 Tax=Ramazzottius varieornatus TaxID=947166 RepID=A0A1D1VQ99_RAMVA|nr:hypothetical protein RvY_11883 [Ramazzottius varieornatus]